MKKIWFVALIFVAGIALAACGGGGGTSSDQTSPDLTSEEQVAVAEMIMSEQAVSNGIENAIGGGAVAMITEDVKSKSVLKDAPVSVTCDMGGTLTVTAEGSGSARTYTAVFDNCAGLFETPGGIGITFSITGTIVIASSTVTYNDMTVLWACVVGGSAFHTCHTSGTITGSGESSTYELTGYCGSTSFTHTGSMSGTLRAADNHFIISGHAVYTMTGPSSGRIVRCNYSDFDATAATCADFATACGLSPTVACSTDCPD